MLEPTALMELIRPFLSAYPRALAMMAVVPLFPSAMFAFLIRNGIVLALLLGAYPMLALQAPPWSWSGLQWSGFMLKEVFIGLMLGYAIGVLIWAFESAGALIDNQVGLNNANVFDPFGGHQGGPYAAFVSQLAVMAFVACGGLMVLVSLLYESFTLWPMASFAPQLTAGYAKLMMDGLQWHVALSVQLAAPLLIVLVLVEFGIGLVNRVAPQLDTFFFSMPIKAAIAALMMAVMMGFWVDLLRTHVAGLRAALKPFDAEWRVPGKAAR